MVILFLSTLIAGRHLVVADPKILKRRGGILSAPPSFIANAHNEIYAFYTEKAAY